MILSYIARLACLCFASFFVVHTAFATAIWAAARRAICAGESMRPRSGARFLLTLRLLPVTFAALLVAGLCIPSYLWLETNRSTERVGLACCFAALLGALVCAVALSRSLRALFVSWRESMRCERSVASKLPGHSLPVAVVESKAPVLALVGLMRSRVIVSRSILQSLSTEELATAIAHERAHRRSRDNWKRLALALAPEILPFTQAFGVLNRGWAKLIEWAADDEAAAGSLGRSLSLAAALVRVAGMRGGDFSSPLVSFLVGDDRELSTRVDRLLAPSLAQGGFPRALRTALMIAAGCFAVLALAAVFHPTAFTSVHAILEQLLR